MTCQEYADLRATRDPDDLSRTEVVAIMKHIKQCHACIMRGLSILFQATPEEMELGAYYEGKIRDAINQAASDPELNEGGK